MRDTSEMPCVMRFRGWPCVGICLCVGGHGHPESESGMTTIPNWKIEDELPAPFDLFVDHSPEGEWSVMLRWEYGYRFAEISHFEIYRQEQGSDQWELVTADIPGSSRTSMDTLPGAHSYTYAVMGVSHDKRRTPMSSAATGTAGNFPYYVSPRIQTREPTGIRKPIPSTRNKVFLTWDPHPQAAGYLLEAIGRDGIPYLSTHVPDPLHPVALLHGPHPEKNFTARVSVLRQSPKGKRVVASSSDSQITLDEVSHPRFTVLDLSVQETPSVAPDRTRGVVLALAEARQPPHLVVNGALHDDAWRVDDDGHASAVVGYVAPVSGGISATMATGCSGHVPSVTRDK